MTAQLKIVKTEFEVQLFTIFVIQNDYITQLW